MSLFLQLEQDYVSALHKGGDDLVAHKQVHSHPSEEGQSSSGLENINIKFLRILSLLGGYWLEYEQTTNIISLLKTTRVNASSVIVLLRRISPEE